MLKRALLEGHSNRDAITKYFTARLQKEAEKVMCQYVHINMRVTHTPCNLLAMTHYSGDLKYAMTSRSNPDAVIEVHKVEAVGKRRVVTDTAEYAASNAPAKHEPSQTQNC
jgi:hypothetical protein